MNAQDDGIIEHLSLNPHPYFSHIVNIVYYAGVDIKWN